MDINNKVFLRRTKTLRRPSFRMRDIMGQNTTKGEVGIEIEVEGKNIPSNLSSLQPYWTFHKDGSLRGEESGEYVLARPIPFDKVSDACDLLWSLFEKKKTVFDESNRTSVHVHLNCQEFHLDRIACFSALYLCFEEVLTEWCGEFRVGNLFCLRSKDAPSIVNSIKKFLEADGKMQFSSGMHYSGFNISALQKFGSIEIRTMRGVQTADLITDWVSILERLYTLSGEFKDPRDIPALFSEQGPSDFFSSVLGDKAQLVSNGINMNDQQIRESMYEGIRFAQDICYCRDWTLLDRVEDLKDPFKRSSKDVMASMIQAVQAATAMEASALGAAAQYTQAATGFIPPPPSSPSPLWFNELTDMDEEDGYEDEDDSI